MKFIPHTAYATLFSKQLVTDIVQIVNKSRSILQEYSSRMRTVRSSGRRGTCIAACTGKGACIPACTGWGVYPSVHWAWGCVFQHTLGWGGSVQGVVPAQRGCLAQCMLGYTPPVDRMTDACENITLPQLRCGR